MFRVGQKVVCVDTTGWIEADYRSGWNYPRYNDVGTVSRIYPHPEGWCVELIEFPNDHPEKPGFLARRFRPVVERKTDIGFAHEILRKVSRKQGADA